MTTLRTLAVASTIAAAVAVPTALAATTSHSAAASASPSVDLPIHLRLDGSKHVDTAALPTSGTLFSERELAPIVPGLESVETQDDTLTLMVKGERDANRSKIVVTLKRFGTRDDVRAAWNTEKKAHEARSRRYPGIYTFFGPNTHGAADSFSDGTTTHVLLENGDAAGEIWFSGIGFASLGSSEADARAAYRKDVVPKLVELLGAKVAAGSSSSGSSGPTSSSAPTSSAATATSPAATPSSTR